MQFVFLPFSATPHFPFSLFNFLPPALLLLLFFNLQPNMLLSLLTSPPTPCKGPCGRVRQGEAGQVWLTVWSLRDKLWDLSCVFRTECWKLGTSLQSYVGEAVALSVVMSCCLSPSPPYFLLIGSFHKYNLTYSPHILLYARLLMRFIYS